MSDLFQDGVPDEYIRQVVQVMVEASHHQYQVLTKRAERMEQMLNGTLAEFKSLPHIWWGVSVEDQRFGLPRVELLRKAKSTVSFLSVEPLLEDLGGFDFRGISWVIVGGESGPGARPMHPNWVRRIRDHSTELRIPFFFKQWGGTRKHLTGRELDGRTWDDFPHQANMSASA
jgi:protein gp37